MKYSESFRQADPLRLLALTVLALSIGYSVHLLACSNDDMAAVGTENYFPMVHGDRRTNLT